MNNFNFKTIVIVFAIFFFSACAPQTFILSPEGEKIALLRNPEEFPQCVYVDDLKAMSLSGGVNSYQQALVKIRNKVAAFRGTHFRIRSADTNDLVTKIEGEMYRCPLTKDRQIQEMTLDPSFRVSD